VPVPLNSLRKPGAQPAAPSILHRKPLRSRAYAEHCARPTTSFSVRRTWGRHDGHAVNTPIDLGTPCEGPSLPQPQRSVVQPGTNKRARARPPQKAATRYGAAPARRSAGKASFVARRSALARLLRPGVSFWSGQVHFELVPERVGAPPTSGRHDEHAVDTSIDLGRPSEGSVASAAVAPQSSPGPANAPAPAAMKSSP